MDGIALFSKRSGAMHYGLVFTTGKWLVVSTKNIVTLF